MRLPVSCFVAALLLTAGADSARATVAFSDSDIFLLDTVTAVSGPDVESPAGSRMMSIQPNPFNPGTTISFEAEADGPVLLAIYDLRGRLVREMISGTVTAGPHHAVWHGRDRADRSVPAGAYLCRLVRGGRVQTMKLLLAK